MLKTNRFRYGDTRVRPPPARIIIQRDAVSCYGPYKTHARIPQTGGPVTGCC